MSSVEGLDELLATLNGLGGDIKESSRKGLERRSKEDTKKCKVFSTIKNRTSS